MSKSKCQINDKSLNADNLFYHLDFGFHLKFEL